MAGRGFLDMWTVYERPHDHPGSYVARLWHVDGRGPQATGEIMLAAELELIREQLRQRGLVCLARHDADDPCIVETWV